MINLTIVAQQALKSLLEARNSSASQGLRLSVSQGGCAGWQYEMKVDLPQATDLIIEDNGVRIFIDSQSKDYLKDCQIDYSDELSDAGFRIINPNADRSCGCGTSFEPKKTHS